MLLTHTQGATFSYAGTATLPAGTWTAAASVGRADGSKVSDFTVTLAPLGSVGPAGETHSLLLSATAAVTLTWPIEELVARVWFTDADGVKLPSPQLTVQVEKG